MFVFAKKNILITKSLFIMLIHLYEYTDYKMNITTRRSFVIQLPPFYTHVQAIFYKRRNNLFFTLLISIHVTNNAIAVKQVPIHDSAVYARNTLMEICISLLHPSFIVNNMHTQRACFYIENIKACRYISRMLLIFC